MINLIRADALRIRTRRDLAAVVVGVALIHGLVFLQGFGIVKADVDQVTSLPAPTEDAAGFIEEQQAYAARMLAPFAIPSSVTTMSQPGFPVLLVGVAFLAAVVMGSDFDWKTLRGAVLLAGSRRRYLVARHATIWAMVVVVIVLIGLLGPVLSIVLLLLGSPVGWNGQSVLPAIVSMSLLALEGFVYASLAVAITTATRSLATGLIGAVVVFGADALITVALRSNQPTLAFLTVSGSLGKLSAAESPAQVFMPAGVALLWLLAGVALSIFALERRDILE